MAVVGAGVGGHTAAAAMRRRGFDVTVFERAPRLPEQGTGLWTNAVAALRDLGLVSLLVVNAEPIERMSFLSARGERPTEIDLDRTARRFHAPSVNVHRSELLGALANAVGDEAIEFDARCVGFEQNADGVTTRFADEAERRADLLIRGEDDRSGARSWSGWHGVAPQRPAGFPERTALFVLSPAFGGLYLLTGDRVHWFLDDPAPPGPSAVVLRRRKGCRLVRWRVCRQQRERPWPPPLGARSATNKVRDLTPFKRWGTGRITLLGDAAHPMLPTLGQGACQATVDTAALVCRLGSGADVEAALRAYEHRRSRRVAIYVRSSRRSAAAWRALLASLHDALIRATPPQVLSFLFGRIIRPAEA